jgi:hypothetical protein
MKEIPKIYMQLFVIIGLTTVTIFSAITAHFTYKTFVRMGWSRNEEYLPIIAANQEKNHKANKEILEKIHGTVSDLEDITFRTFASDFAVRMRDLNHNR